MSVCSCSAKPTHDEMRIYLQELLDHEGACEVDNCSLCQLTQSIYGLITDVIFSEVVYPQVTIAFRRQLTEASSPPVGDTTIPVPRAA